MVKNEALICLLRGFNCIVDVSYLFLLLVLIYLAGFCFVYPFNSFWDFSIIFLYGFDIPILWDVYNCCWQIFIGLIVLKHKQVNLKIYDNKTSINGSQLYHYNLYDIFYVRDIYRNNNQLKLSTIKGLDNLKAIW